MNTTLSIPDQLRAAAVEIDGQLWVRAATAMRIMGLSLGFYQMLPTRWHVSELRLPARPARGSSLGVQVFWLLQSLLRFASDRARLRGHRAWTEDENARLIEMLKSNSMQKIARHFGRTQRAVIHQVTRLGGLRKLWREHHRLITSGQLMKLTRKRAYETILHWRRLGLKHLRSPSGRKDTLYNLRDVRAFFVLRPHLLVTLHPEARKLLRLINVQATGPKSADSSRSLGEHTSQVGDGRMERGLIQSRMVKRLNVLHQPHGDRSKRPWEHHEISTRRTTGRNMQLPAQRLQKDRRSALLCQIDVRGLETVGKGSHEDSLGLSGLPNCSRLPVDFK